MVEAFKKEVKDRTDRRGIETGSYLFAAMHQKPPYKVSHLVIPKQTATGYEFVVSTEGDTELGQWAARNNLFMVGGMHTHPAKLSRDFSAQDVH